MATVLPEGVSAGDFDAAVKEMRAVVGNDWVHTDRETDLQAYVDPMSAVPRGHRMPSAAVSAASVEEIRAVLKVANKYRLPLWTYGNGKNFAYGGPAPKHAGYVVLDLKRMNRILDVDEDHGTCLVEPGVSYFQLYQHLQEIGSNLWIDCAAPGWGGVMGNALEHGAGYTPYADHYVMSCGMEIMLADGSLVRTGMGAMPDSHAWQLFKYGYGPYLDGMFTQGNFGIVTKMGFWLMPAPPMSKPFLFTFENEEDLHPLMEILRPLKISMAWQNGAIAEHISYSAAVLNPRSHYTDSKELISQTRWQEIAKELDLGMWNVYGCLYGLPENVEMTFQMIQGAMTSIPGARVFLEGDRDDPGFIYRANLMRGIPNMTEFNLVNWDGGGHLNFSPIGPFNGATATKMFELMREICNQYGFDLITEMVATFRGLIGLTMVMFDAADEDARKRADACSRDIILRSAEEGWGELKANLEYMQTVAGIYNGQDNGLWKVNQILKDSLDPNGILSPGKSGIWPSNWPGLRD